MRILEACCKGVYERDGRRRFANSGIRFSAVEQSKVSSQGIFIQIEVDGHFLDIVRLPFCGLSQCNDTGNIGMEYREGGHAGDLWSTQSALLSAFVYHRL